MMHWLINSIWSSASMKSCIMNCNYKSDWCISNCHYKSDWCISNSNYKSDGCSNSNYKSDWCISNSNYKSDWCMSNCNCSSIVSCIGLYGALHAGCHALWIVITNQIDAWAIVIINQLCHASAYMEHCMQAIMHCEL